MIPALIAAGLAAAVPAAARQDHPTICESAFNARGAVKHKLGPRAPGRNICRFGVRLSNSRVVKATYGQKVRYLHALNKLVAPAPVLLVRTAVPPPQLPAGTLTASVRAPAGGILASIRACESGGNYSTDTGNGFGGAYQFDQQTWSSVGGVGSPANASPAEQDRLAAKLYAQRGSAPWPVCGR